MVPTRWVMRRGDYVVPAGVDPQSDEWDVGQIMVETDGVLTVRWYGAAATYQEVPDDLTLALRLSDGSGFVDHDIFVDRGEDPVGALTVVGQVRTAQSVLHNKPYEVVGAGVGGIDEGAIPCASIVEAIRTVLNPTAREGAA